VVEQLVYWGLFIGLMLSSIEGGDQSPYWMKEDGDRLNELELKEQEESLGGDEHWELENLRFKKAEGFKSHDVLNKYSFTKTTAARILFNKIYQCETLCWKCSW
jgi:hypothetical protein